MKKILSIVVVLAAVTMVSCCGNSNKTAEAATTEAAATEVPCEQADSCCTVVADSTATVEAAPATEAVVK
ncbi:MAG: hypothetical protein RSB29_04545 [Alistipes sp.]